ncbi:MAG: SMI1/KNR4 family protein, partial [Pirellulaceae bacterium]|nr:SMI1/KNR4 family protein [Pirellulaceae bacterium]
MNRIKDRVSDPLQFLDSAAWVSPQCSIGPTATQKDVADAEHRLGFCFPPLMRRLYTEIGNGSWGPYYGFSRIPTNGLVPTGDDLVGFYLTCVSEERAMEEPLVNWPRGLVAIIDRGCVDYELCDFIASPHPVYLLSGDTWKPN